MNRRPKKLLQKKKGFTLIEIIVCIVLIALIGTSATIGITKAVSNNKYNNLNKITTNFENALEVYLSLHQEVEENLMLSTKAAVITLETLKNEGLIEAGIKNPVDNETFDYTNTYFALLDAEVVENDPLESDGSCDFKQIGINVIKSWNLEGLDSEVIYICPRKDYTEEINLLQEKVDDLASQIEDLKSKNNNATTNSDSGKDKLKINTLYNDLTYTAKGINPNNYVYFEVVSNPSDFAYFQNTTNIGLWRIVSINTNNEIELVYTEPVLSNNSQNYTNESHQWCDSGMEEDRKSTCTFYKLNHTPAGLYTSEYYRYENGENVWLTEEMLEDVTVEGSKKSYIYNSIKNKNWIISKKYFPNYTVNSTSGEISFNSNYNKEMKIGQVNYNQINSSINISESWLNNYNMVLGYSNVSKSFDDYYFYIYNNSGNLDKSERQRVANRCTNSQCTRDKDSSSDYHLYGGNYYPLITLSNKVELVEPTCSEGKIIGSKECPYKLTCDNC